MAQTQHAFLQFAIDSGVLRFGRFQTKAGRSSPYFFNAGLFYSGGLLGRLAGFYAETLQAAQAERGLSVDLLFGPAYKGITLASATAVAMAARGQDLPFAFNRKEAKGHGEGGLMVGAPIQGRVLIIDDVISAGTSVRESVAMICAEGAEPCGVLIALDRMERGGTAEAPTAHSAVQETEQAFGIPVFAIAGLTDLLELLRTSQSAELQQHAQAVSDYRERWGA
jgi:orotate phosphoribosyltransferase